MQGLLKEFKYYLTGFAILTILLLIGIAIRATAGQSHPASEITAGTFGSGNYTFPNNVTINGTLFINGMLFLPDGVKLVWASGRNASCTNFGTINCNASDSDDYIEAYCPSGMYVLGGGCSSEKAANICSIVPSTRMWYCDWNGDAGRMVVWLICALIYVTSY